MSEGNNGLSKSTKQYIEDAISHYNKQRYQDALEAIEQAVRRDPTSVKALHGRGIVLAQMKEYKKALECYEQASKLAPNIAQIYADLAEVSYLLKDYEKSGSGYRKAIELDSKYESVYRDKAKYLFDKAFRLRKPVTRDKAITAFQQVLLFDPDDATANSELAKLQKIKASLSKGKSSVASVHPCNCSCPSCMNY